MYTSQFQTMQPDYALESLSLKPDKSIGFSLLKSQSIEKLAGSRVNAYTVSNFHDAKFTFNLKNLTESQKDTLLDLYCDKYKANGKGKSIIYSHPIYDESFVCKFDSQLKDFFDRNERYNFSTITLSVIGTDRNLISTSSWVVGNTTATGYSAIDGSGGGSGYDTVFNYDEVLDYEEVL